MRHRLVPLDDPDGWNDALQGLRHAPAHTHAHAFAFAASSPDETFLYVGCDDDGTPAVVCPLAVRGEPHEQDVYTPFGFSGFASAADRPGFAAEWDAFAAEQGWVATYALQHPALTNDLGLLTGAAEVMCYVVDVTEPADVLLARMAKDRRAEVRRWLREPAGLVRDPDEILAFVLANADAFYGERSAAALYHFAPETWRRLVGSPAVITTGLRRDGRLVAVMLNAAVGDIAEGLFTFSGPAGSRSTTPLFWEAIADAAARSATTFNLGGGARPDDGIVEFKRRLGAQPVPAYGIRLVHRTDAFETLCHRAGVAPVIDGYFPPYRRRQP